MIITTPPPPRIFAAPTYTVGTPNISISSGSNNVTVPTGVAADDIVVIFAIQSGNPAATFTAPAGFSDGPSLPFTFDAAGDGRDRIYVWWKKATGSDTGSYTFTSASSTVSAEALAVSFRGCYASPWEASSQNAKTLTGAAGACPAVSLTTTQPNDLLVYIGCDVSGWGNTTPPAGFTEIYDSGMHMDVCVKVQSAAGASGSVAGTHGTSANTGSWIGALKSI